MKIEELFKNYELELTPELKNRLVVKYNSILIPSKIEAKFKYIGKKELKEIHTDELVAKELILTILKNFSDTFILSQQNNSSEAVKMGYKVLNATILKGQVKYDSKISSPYRKILNLLLKYDIIEKGRSYSTGERSNEYRLTSTYFGKGFVEYNLQTSFLRKNNMKFVEDNLEKVLKCPIATSELLNREFITFPTQEEAKKYLIKLSKEKFVNKKGKKIVYLNKRNREDFKDCVFIEDYLEILDYLTKINIPIIESERGGNRIITAFNFIPSVLRPLCKFNGESLVEADYSCLHPNICQFIYGGSNQEIITHDKVANYLGVERSVAKIGHLSFFNLPWKQMYSHKLFKYYYENEPKMMQNIYEIKEEKGYKSVSTDCFYFETELMRENIKTLRELGIKVLYCFDALYCSPKDYETVKRIMNENAKKYGILTEV